MGSSIIVTYLLLFLLELLRNELINDCLRFLADCIIYDGTSNLAWGCTSCSCSCICSFSYVYAYTYVYVYFFLDSNISINSSISMSSSYYYSGSIYYFDMQRLSIAFSLFSTPSMKLETVLILLSNLS